MLEFSRWFCLLTGLIWSGYGIACAFYPEIITRLTGINIDLWTAEIEIRAWYLQTEVCLAILCYFGWKQPEKYLALNLLVWVVGFTILVFFRIYGTWLHDSSFAFRYTIDYLPENYHITTAYVYEIPSMLVFWYLWLQRKAFLGPV